MTGSIYEGNDTYVNNDDIVRFKKDVTGGIGFSVAGGGLSAACGTLAAQSQLQAKAIADQAKSFAQSRMGYEDTASTLFIESWASASANWTQGATPGQVSGGKLYAGATPDGGSGQNHSYALSGTDNLRAVFALTIPAGNMSGGVIIGVSKDAAGAVPAAGGANVFGLYFANGVGVVPKAMDTGAAAALTGQNLVTAGDYIVTVIVDQVYISVTAAKTDGTNELYCRRLRTGFTVNNIFAYNSDSRALTGMAIGPCGARKGLQTIAPRTTSSEGVSKTIQWSGDGSNNYMVFLPAGYDSRKPSPVAMCFHGNGTDETAWISNVNYSTLQRALVNAGYIVVACCLGSSTTTWGNAAETDAYYAAYKYVRDNYAIGPVVMMANSMGGIESLNTLAANKIPGVVAWCGTSATTSLADNYANSLFTAAITSAYAISGDYAVKTAGRDPALLPEYSFRQLPMLFITATDDASVVPANNAISFSAKMQQVCPSVTSTLTTGGHSFPIAGFTTAITAFFDSYTKAA